MSPEWRFPFWFHPNRKAAQREGYSLIELVIVLLIVGILAAAAAPKYSHSLQSFRLEAAYHRIAGDVNFARRTAQQNSSTQTIAFNVATNSYALVGASDIDRRSRTYQFSLGQNDYSCQLVSADFGGSSNLTFDIHGRPQSGGTVVIQCGGTTRTLTINSVGQVTSS